MVDQALLDILRCPATKAPLKLVESDGRQWLESTGNGYRYPIRDGIPVMLIDEADKPAGAEPGGAS